MPLQLVVLSLASAAPLDALTRALLAALAPVWPALAPWLVAGGVAVAMGIATEVVVRELRARPRPPRARAPGRGP